MFQKVIYLIVTVYKVAHEPHTRIHREQHLVSLAAGGGALPDGLLAMPHSTQHRAVCVSGDCGLNR